jgi:hypothetical protein
MLLIEDMMFAYWWNQIEWPHGQESAVPMNRRHETCEL